MNFVISFMVLVVRVRLKLTMKMLIFSDFQKFPRGFYKRNFLKKIAKLSGTSVICASHSVAVILRKIDIKTIKSVFY